MTRYGSDVVIDLLSKMGIEQVAFNPGASIRGLQDSLSRSTRPSPVLALHEGVAVGMAHGYFKSVGRPMAVFLHDLVGLQNAQLAIFNAFMDSVPMMIVGGSGPRDWAARRPWIDWVHSAHPQGAFVREVVKWDDEPAGLDSLPAVFDRAWRMAMSAPQGPVYVGVDVLVQEQEAPGVTIPELGPLPPPMTVEPDVVTDIARDLINARFPVIVVDRAPNGSMRPLVTIAESVGAAVIDLGSRMSFPTNHRLNVTGARTEILGQADVVLLVEPRDVVWSLSSIRQGSRVVEPLTRPEARINAVGMTEQQHRGLVDRQAPVGPVRYIDADPPTFLRQLAVHLSHATKRLDPDRVAAVGDRHARLRVEAKEAAVAHGSSRPVHPAFLALTLGQVLDRHGSWQLASGLLGGWPQRLWDFTDEFSYLGRSGGEGLGYSLPASVGAALAQRGTGRIVVDIQGDGDFMYTPQALWTAARERVPLLLVVDDNRGYHRDRLHQIEIATERGMQYSGHASGVDLGEPDIDFVGLAAAQGVEPIGSTSEPGELESLLQRAADVVANESRPAIVSVRTSE